MPMVLRSRKSIRPSELELGSTPAAPASARRRSTRLHQRATYEDSDESDSESVQSQVMEAQQRPLVELEEEAAEETEGIEETDLKHCTVLLDRLRPDNKAARTELEEREDMNRKGGKPVSRIPTFHKRPATAGQSAELQVTKKDLPSHVAPEKASQIGVEPSRSKIADAREKALHPPLTRVPKFGIESPSSFSSIEQASAVAYNSPFTVTKEWSLSGSVAVQSPLLAVTPRPALRAEPDFEEHYTEGDISTTTQSSPMSQLPCEDSPSDKAQDDVPRGHDIDITTELNFAASGDSLEGAHTPNVCQVDAIMDEEPPWKVKAASSAEPEGSRSSSDADCEEDSAGEQSEHCDSGEPEENSEPHVDQPQLEDLVEQEANCDQSTSTTEKPAKDASSKSTKGSRCSSFARFCLLPTLLLLLGGFGQHIWHYGLPMSVVQLTAQLELHWLEGFGLAAEPCSTDCRVHLVESIPEGLYPSTQSSQQSIADSWLHLLDKANNSVHIAAFYLTLRGSDLELKNPTDSQGKQVFEHLKKLHSKGVKLQVAVNAPQTSNKDTSELAAGGADVREVDLNAVTGGIIHTKLWVVDQKHVYLGSANMDWRSLSQVKEVGLSVEDCSCLAQDAFRIFGVYWSIGGENNTSLPPYWPNRLSALSSSQHPLHLKFNGVPAQVYLSSAPPQIAARGRSDDLTTILSVINDAHKFISISVMDYLPMSQYTKPIRFWPDIDSALRAAACARGVKVRLLISCWPHSSGSMFTFLQSLVVLNRHPLKCHIEVKIFTVPSTAEQSKIPFARVNHAKYMVTDRVVYIGTSNWSENYFTQTAGVGLVVNQTGSPVEQGQQTLQSQTEELFFRDWQSDYARPLSVDDVDICPHQGSH